MSEYAILCQQLKLVDQLQTAATFKAELGNPYAKLEVKRLEERKQRLLSQLAPKQVVA